MTKLLHAEHARPCEPGTVISPFTIRFYCLLAIVLAIGLFDAAVLWLAVHPHVSPAYRAYYMTHSLSAQEFITLMRQSHPQGGSVTDTPDAAEF